MMHQSSAHSARWRYRSTSSPTRPLSNVVTLISICPTTLHISLRSHLDLLENKDILDKLNVNVSVNETSSNTVVSAKERADHYMLSVRQPRIATLTLLAC